LHLFLVVTLILAQALLPVVGHSHDEPQYGDHVAHAGFHVHFDGSHHHWHGHDVDDENSAGGFSEQSDAPVVVFLNFAAWEAIRLTSDSDGVEFVAVASVVAFVEPWFEWPPTPVAKPPTSEPLAFETPIYLSLCSFRC
jgi:hypothetical protein